MKGEPCSSVSGYKPPKRSHSRWTLSTLCSVTSGHWPASNSLRACFTQTTNCTRYPSWNAWTPSHLPYSRFLLSLELGHLCSALDQLQFTSPSTSSLTHPPLSVHGTPLLDISSMTTRSVQCRFPSAWGQFSILYLPSLYVSIYFMSYSLYPLLEYEALEQEPGLFFLFLGVGCSCLYSFCFLSHQGERLSLDGWKHGWVVDEQVDGGVDGWVDRQMGGWVHEKRGGSRMMESRWMVDGKITKFKLKHEGWQW